MSFRWLKQYMPRSLYGRAALILMLPIITLQLGISVIFFQRHFERVTEQMTASIALELEYLTTRVAQEPDPTAATAVGMGIATPLQLRVALPAGQPPMAIRPPWYDLSGHVVRRALFAQIDDLEQAVLLQDGSVQVWFDTPHGQMSVDFPRTRVSASNPHQLLVWMVVLSVLMTLIAFSFLRNQLRPIKRLAAASSEYGRGRSVPYHPSGATEVRAAGHAFLNMRNRIERQTQTRTMMLSGVSHDLRTPLTRLRLGLGMLEGDDVAPLLRDLNDMQHLVDAFLDFARDDAADTTEGVDPVALVRQVLDNARRAGQAVAAGQISGQGDLISLRELAIQRALENLINNALRYGSTARISVVVTPKAVVFTVEDDGPGIPAEAREEAVRPFIRLDPARNQDRGSGVGLGLAIVEDIARTHGGVLRLGESEDLGGLKAEIVLGR